MYSDYYYLNIAGYQNLLELGDVVTETGFTYDMNMKKMIIF